MQTLTRKAVLAGRYVLDDQIGTGNGTSVWRATDIVLERLVAVKVLHAQAAAPGAAERFERGARAAAGLTHPNIVAVYDSGLEGQTPFLVMELLEGEPLGQRLAREGPMTPAAAVHVASCVLAALEAMDVSGAGHASLSNEHVFVGPSRQVRISAVGTNDTAGVSPGDDGPVLTRAVGRILYVALTGKEPPARGTASPKALRARVPRDLDAIVARALSPDPAKAFPTLASFSSALSRLRLESNAGPAERHEEPGESSSVFRSWMLAPIVMVVIAALVIAAGLALGRLKIGGPLLVEAKAEPAASSPGRASSKSAEAAPAVEPLAIESASAWDPFGDRHENDANASLAIDQSHATFWKTEDYYSGQLGKPGVGLLLDLGRRQDVSAVRLVTPDPGFRFDIRAGDDPETLARSGADEGGHFDTTSKVTREQLRGMTGRYVLLWITSIEPLPDGTHGASVADIELEGTDAVNG